MGGTAGEGEEADVMQGSDSDDHSDKEKECTLRSENQAETEKKQQAADDRAIDVARKCTKDTVTNRVRRSQSPSPPQPDFRTWTSAAQRD